MHNPVKQPTPFTPGLTREMIQKHAFRIYRDKMKRTNLSLEDWVLAEKDLLAMQEKEGSDEG
jgi:hypothetical protein